MNEKTIRLKRQDFESEKILAKLVLEKDKLSKNNTKTHKTKESGQEKLTGTSKQRMNNQTHVKNYIMTKGTNTLHIHSNSQNMSSQNHGW